MTQAFRNMGATRWTRRAAIVRWTDRFSSYWELFLREPLFFFSFGTKCVNRNAVGELVERSWFTCCFHGKEVDTFRRRGGCWYPRNYFWILLRNSNIINEIVRIVLVNFLLFLLFFLILKNINIILKILKNFFSNK